MPSARTHSRFPASNSQITPERPPTVPRRYQPFLSIRPGVDGAGRFYLTDIIGADQASGPGTPMIQTSGNKVNTISVSGGSLLQNQPVLITDQTVPGLLVLKMHVATTNYGYTNNPHVTFHDNFMEISNQPLTLA